MMTVEAYEQVSRAHAAGGSGASGGGGGAVGGGGAGSADARLLIAIDSIVYDLTAFAAEHPGGRGTLLRQRGSLRATEAFESVGHSTTARKMMKQYAVALLCGQVPCAGIGLLVTCLPQAWMQCCCSSPCCCSCFCPESDPRSPPPLIPASHSDPRPQGQPVSVEERVAKRARAIKEGLEEQQQQRLQEPYSYGRVPGGWVGIAPGVMPYMQWTLPLLAAHTYLLLFYPYAGLSSAAAPSDASLLLTRSVPTFGIHSLHLRQWCAALWLSALCSSFFYLCTSTKAMVGSSTWIGTSLAAAIRSPTAHAHALVALLCHFCTVALSQGWCDCLFLGGGAEGAVCCGISGGGGGAGAQAEDGDAQSTPQGISIYLVGGGAQGALPLLASHMLLPVCVSLARHRLLTSRGIHAALLALASTFTLMPTVPSAALALSVTALTLLQLHLSSRCIHTLPGQNMSIYLAAAYLTAALHLLPATALADPALTSTASAAALDASAFDPSTASLFPSSAGAGFTLFLAAFALSRRVHIRAQTAKAARAKRGV